MKHGNIENRIRNAAHTPGNRTFYSDLLERQDICTDCPQVIHSSIIPAENDFILFEVDSSEEWIRLHLEKGIKNGKEVEISLYTNGGPIERILLRNRRTMEIGNLNPGRYTLYFEKSAIFRFYIEE